MVIARNFNDESKWLFKSSKSNNLRFKNMGFSNHVSAIVSLPNVPLSMAQRVAEAIVGLHTKLTPAVRKQWNEGTLRKSMRKFSYNCIPTWGSEGTFVNPTIEQLITLQPVSNTDIGSNSPDSLCRPGSCIFQCPRCGTPKQVAHIKMAKEHTWNTLVCASALCHNKAASSRWLCPCGLRWQACRTHSQEGFKCGLPKPRDSKDSAGKGSIPAPRPRPLPEPTEYLPKRSRKLEADKVATLPSRKRKASCQAAPWCTKLPKLPQSLEARFGYLRRDPPSQENHVQGASSSSNSSAPPMRSDPG